MCNSGAKEVKYTTRQYVYLNRMYMYLFFQTNQNNQFLVAVELLYYDYIAILYEFTQKFRALYTEFVIIISQLIAPLISVFKKNTKIWCSCTLVSYFKQSKTENSFSNTKKNHIIWKFKQTTGSYKTLNVIKQTNRSE